MNSSEINVRKGFLLAVVIALLVALTGLALAYNHLATKLRNSETLPLANLRNDFRDIHWGASADGHIQATFVAHQGDSPTLFLKKVGRYITAGGHQPIEYSNIGDTWMREMSTLWNYQDSWLFHHINCTVVFSTKLINKVPRPDSRQRKHYPSPKKHLPSTSKKKNILT